MLSRFGHAAIGISQSSSITRDSSEARGAAASRSIIKLWSSLPFMSSSRSISKLCPPLPFISCLLCVAVGKCARDPYVYVRKCVANALPKLNDLRIEENASTIEEIIGILLNDNSPGVVGAFVLIIVLST